MSKSLGWSNTPLHRAHYYTTTWTLRLSLSHFRDFSRFLFHGEGRSVRGAAWHDGMTADFPRQSLTASYVFIFFLFPEEWGLTQGSAGGSWHIPNMNKHDRSILLLCAVIAVTTFLTWFMSVFIVHSFIFGNLLPKWFQNPANCCLPEPSGSKIPFKPKTTFGHVALCAPGLKPKPKLPIASLFAHRKAN